eukprot:5194477-Amphidinium_carterae.1
MSSRETRAAEAVVAREALPAAAPSSSADASSHEGGEMEGDHVEADCAIEAVEGKKKQRKKTIVPPKVKVWFFDFCQKSKNHTRSSGTSNSQQCLNAGCC